MGLFEDIGRKVGKISHEAKEASREQANYECADCGNLIYSEREDCPECGSELLEPHEPDDGDSAAEGGSNGIDDSPDEDDESTVDDSEAGE